VIDGAAASSRQLLALERAGRQPANQNANTSKQKVPDLDLRLLQAPAAVAGFQATRRCVDSMCGWSRRSRYDIKSHNWAGKGGRDHRVMVTCVGSKGGRNVIYIERAEAGAFCRLTKPSKIYGGEMWVEMDPRAPIHQASPQG